MATIEKLIVQIFDRKRQIIQQLNHHKQLYHQHLLSKLLIQGISPPPYLLTSEFHSSTSHLSELNKEELISGLLLPRSGPLISYPSGPCLLYDKPAVAAANSGIPDVTYAVQCSSSNGVIEDEPFFASPSHANGSEDMAGVALLSHFEGTNNTSDIVPPSHIDGFVETSNYVPMSPEDQIDTRLSNAYKPEESRGRIQRSRSRQKALELRNSAKANGKSRFGMEDDASKTSRRNMCYDEHLDGLQESLELGKRLALPSEHCVNEVVAMGNSSNKKRIADAGSDSLTQPRGSKGKEVRSGDSEMEKKSTVYSGSFTRSRSCSQQPICIPSGSKTYIYGEHLDLSSESMIGEEPSRFPSDICSKEEVIANFTDKEKTNDAIGASLTYPRVLEEKEVEVGGNQKSEECSNVYGGRITRSRSSCRQYIGGTLPLYLKSNEVCIGQMTRSKSGKMQKAVNGDLQSARCSSYCNQPINADRAFGNSKADSGKITPFRSGEAKEVDIENERNWSRKDVSVKPKQLDFDEFEESNLGRIPNYLSGAISQSEGDMLPDFSVSYAMDGSWPCYKRRKIEYQNFNKSASPTLRVNSFYVINDIAAKRSSEGEKENIPSLSQNLTNSHPVGAPFSSCAKEIYRSVSSSPSKEHVSTPLVQCGKVEVSLGRFVMSSTCEPRHVSEPNVSNVDKSIIAEPSESLSVDGKETLNAPSSVFCNVRVSDGLLKDQYLVDVSTAMKLMDTHMNADQKIFFHSVDESKFSIGSPLMEHMDVAEADQSIPEFEGFVIGKNTADLPNSTDELAIEDVSFLSNIMDKTSLTGKVCNSATLSTTPVSPFPSACKVYLAPGIYSSVPNGLLEHIDLRSFLWPSGNALLRKSQSDVFPSPGSQYGWDTKKPFLSPVGNSFEAITSESGDSDKLGSNNLELTCFPIMEDPESSEEEVIDAVNTGVETTNSTMNSIANMEQQIGISMEIESSLAPNLAIERESSESVSSDVKETESTMKSIANMEPHIDTYMENESSLAPNHAIERVSSESVSSDVKETDSNRIISSNKEPLCNVTLQHENSLVLDPSVSKCSLGSVSEFGIHKMHSNVKKSVMGQRSSRQTRLGKENKGFSIGANSSKKHAKAQSSRFSKPQLSAISNLRSRGQSMTEKEHKPNNIVSNMKSFLPLVQQKQAAAVAPEKRDVKVKALQAAEAAKRAAEKREYERRQKKEAMNLERARVEQEHLREMELKKKLKEEERKRREAEKVAKKRQREEEERQEKERKKKRIEDARLQLKQAEEKLHACREESRCASEDEGPHKKQDCDDITAKQVNRGHEGGDTGKLMNNSVVAGNDRRKADDRLTTVIDHKMSTGSSAAGKAGSIDIAESSTPNFDKNKEAINQCNVQKSYDISPYQCSDDEDEEDEIPNKKFVPSWASKSAVALALSSLQHIDPEEIYPPGSFCSLDEGFQKGGFPIKSRTFPAGRQLLAHKFH